MHIIGDSRKLSNKLIKIRRIKMKVIFFCENKNSIILSNKILDNPRLLNSNINIEFITCDWSETITKWINSLNVNIHVYNIMDDFIDDRNSLLKNIDKATKSDIIKNVFIKYLKINRPDLIIIYNDSSLRGYACSIAVRQLNIHRFLIQDGHLNFDSKSNLLYKTSFSTPINPLNTVSNSLKNAIDSLLSFTLKF